MYIIYILTPILCVYYVVIMLCVILVFFQTILESLEKSKLRDDLEFYILFVFFASTE